MTPLPQQNQFKNDDGGEDKQVDGRFVETDEPVKCDDRRKGKPHRTQQAEYGESAQGGCGQRASEHRMARVEPHVPAGAQWLGGRPAPISPTGLRTCIPAGVAFASGAGALPQRQGVLGLGLALDRIALPLLLGAKKALQGRHRTDPGAKGPTGNEHDREGQDKSQGHAGNERP